MAIFGLYRSKAAGLPPGTLIHIGAQRTETVRIGLIDYDEDSLQEQEVASPEECFPYQDKPTVTWINVDGLHDVEVIRALGDRFRVHPLVQEDIVNTNQRPKMEDFEDYMYLVFKMLFYDEKQQGVVAEQVSVILAKNTVISFQEREGDVFDGVRERIRSSKGRIRKCGADYLAYSLLDAVVDSYFGVLEKVGERIEGLEEAVLATPSARTLHAVQRLRTEGIALRKSVWPLREMVSGLMRSESGLIGDALRPYLSDVYDHTIQVADATESLRDVVGGLRDTYLSSVSNRMNEVMKVLTIIATIFIPITFIAGIYGMNFEYMPELKWKGAYFVALAAMAATALAMLVYFRKKEWV